MEFYAVGDFLEPASSNHYLCSILRRFHIGFSFWPWWLPLGTQAHALLLSGLVLKGTCCGREVRRQRERYQRGKLYNILLSLFVNTAVYSAFKCARTHKQTSCVCVLAQSRPASDMPAYCFSILSAFAIIEYRSLCQRDSLASGYSLELLIENSFCPMGQFSLQQPYRAE